MIHPLRGGYAFVALAALLVACGSSDATSPFPAGSRGGADAMGGAYAAGGAYVASGGEGGTNVGATGNVGAGSSAGASAAGGATPAGGAGGTTPAGGAGGTGGVVPVEPPPFMPDPVTMGLDLPAVVPVMRISVGGQPVEKDVELPGTVEIFETHAGTLTDLDAIAPTAASPIAFQGRGNFTWSLPKKGYALELQDGAGQGIDLSILGLPPGSDFALYACYTDKTCLRNALVFGVGQELGRWSPRTRFVELIVDGDYLGLYMLWERIRVDVDRVRLPRPAASASLGDLSGGYVVRLEGGGKGTRWVGGVAYPRDFTVSSGRVYTYHYPKPQSITPEQSAYVAGLLDGFEGAMAVDPGGFATRIDVGSWVDHAIIEELTNNWDGYVHSIYMTKEPDADGGRIGMGPLWDFDLAFANGDVTGYNCRTDNWAYQNVRSPPDDVPQYWLALFANPAFMSELACRWAALRQGPLALSTFDARIAAWVSFTQAARARDQQRWSTVGTFIFPNCDSWATYDEEVAGLRDWIARRLDWLDAQLNPLATCAP